MTPISTWRGPLRLFLDDWDPNVRRYPDATLDSGVATMVRMGWLNRVRGAPAGGFSITPDGNNITPDVVSTSPQSANWFAYAGLRTTKLFLDPKLSRSSFRTRPVSVSQGDCYRYLGDIEAALWELENGAELFEGYQSYWSWINSVSGLPLGEILAGFKLGSPLWTATFTRDGLRVA